MNSLDLQVSDGEIEGEDDREEGRYILQRCGGGGCCWCWWLAVAAAAVVVVVVVVVGVVVVVVVVAAPGYPGWDDQQQVHPSIFPQGLAADKMRNPHPIFSANFLRLVWIYKLHEETRGFDHENPQLHQLSTSSGPGITRHQKTFCCKLKSCDLQGLIDPRCRLCVTKQYNSIIPCLVLLFFSWRFLQCSFRWGPISYGFGR